MTTILFWNLNNKPLIPEIVELCQQQEVDIIILAESPINAKQLLTKLNKLSQTQYYQPTPIINKWLSFYCRQHHQIKIVSDLDRIAIRQLINPDNIDINLVALHLPSKLYRNSPEQLINSVKIANIIRKEEQKIGHNRTLVIGDFNMNPFEDGMVAAQGFHGVMTPEIARKRSRKVDGINYLYFYNPLWQKMGNTTQEAPGTYYYNNSNAINYFWNTFDQILLRPELLDYFTLDNLNIITKIGNKSLLKNHQISHQFSDHLPLLISLNLNRSISNDH